MLRDLYDNFSLLFSSRWPKAEGVVTAVDVRSVRYGGDDRPDLRLVVVYEFSLAGDGPYTGQSGSPFWFGTPDVMNIGEKRPVGHAVTIRYRRDDPSVNKLDRSVWGDFDGI